MRKDLLTLVITDLVNRRESSKEYGVSIINIPDFDYVSFVSELSCERCVDFFFLGFTTEKAQSIEHSLPETDKYSYSFSIEEAEESRNSGDESRFRVFIIRRAGIEKLSSLRWFPEITVDMVYNHSCDYVLKGLRDSNSVIDSIIRALKRKTIRNILGFERVIDYLDSLFNAEPDVLTKIIKQDYYKLGLLSDQTVDQGNSSVEDIVSKIKRNHDIVERIGNLEQAERQSITNYYASSSGAKRIPRLILQYYSKKDTILLGSMELSEVEECLKAVKKTTKKPDSKKKTSTAKPTSLASQLVFDDNVSQIEELLTQIKKDVDDRSNPEKKETIEVDVDGTKLQIKTEPVTEKIASDLIDDNDYGRIIYADVNSPDEAINDIEKYESTIFDKKLLDQAFQKLQRIGEIIPEGESITNALRRYVIARNNIIEYSKRLQDVPMFPVLAHIDLFKEYLKSYEVLLLAINNEYPRILSANATSTIRGIINTIMSLDNIFILGKKNTHVIPTPLNPLYLWKYIKLSEEILESKGIDSANENSLSDDDKSFIIRKAEDIPDPLSVMLVPSSVNDTVGVFLPLTGRIGNMPMYSTNKQINQSESGVDALKQSIIRYLCLYPHAGMMLKISIIDPPSVELMVSMLKKLNSDREFNISGIDLSIFRTKESTSDWVEIDDDSMNDGMLGQYKGKRSLNFRLKIQNKTLSYQKVLSEIKDNQHMMIVFDPNEVKTEVVRNNNQIHIHPLCIPKVYQYNPVEEEVVIRPANEGDIFTTYGSIVEKINEHPSSFSHTSSVFNTPLKRSTYDEMLQKSDWLIILDQSLKNWDVSLRAASEKLYYKENDYRSIGIYSENNNKFLQGYKNAITNLGNFIPQDKGLSQIINAIRSINDDGLLSIVSHSSNRIFDENHGKGSLGLAITAINYMRKYPNAILVGLDTQLAHEWLSGRDDNCLPDLVGIRLDELIVDIIEVKTYKDNENSFVINNGKISGHAVEQTTILESLMKEICGQTERITTISRREILRQQVYETLFQSELNSAVKHALSEQLNLLFAGQLSVTTKKQISFVDFENSISKEEYYQGDGDFEGNTYQLNTIGSAEIQSIVSGVDFVSENLNDNNEPKEAPTIETDEPSKEACTVENNDNLPVNAEMDFVADDVVIEKCNRLNKVLKDYNISALPVNPELVQEAARFTRFTVELKSGESIKSIEKSKADIGIQLESNGEILVNHIRGTKYISVDVPFAGSGKPINLIEHLNKLSCDKEKLDIVAGQTPDGKYEVLDISKAPHLLVAGTTGSGKTIFLYSIMVSLLQQFNKDEIEFLIVDPKQTDFVFFDDLPNLYGGKVVTDADEALEMLNKINEVDKEERMRMIRSCKSRDINSYNEKNPNNRMKRLVVIIDEYADLIQTAEMQGNRKEFERSLCMLAQKVRSLGIHLIIATQRPSANIVTGVLKANIPYRISFRLPSHTDSQTILDMTGAENLLGMGDMLIVTESSDVKRVQGLYITENELSSFVEDYVNRNEQ